MNKLIGWTLLAALTTTLGCTSDQHDENNVACQRVTIDQTDYCTYQQPITETGYDCPADLPNAIPFEGHTVCSREQDIPPAHQAPLREHIAHSDTPPDGGWDVGEDTLDADTCHHGSCDASLTSLVSFDFYKPDGHPYCGDVTIRAWTVDEANPTMLAQCDCVDGEMGRVNEPRGCFLWEGDVEGKTLHFKIEASNYAPFTTSDDVPCQCHPNLGTMRVDFENR